MNFRMVFGGFLGAFVLDIVLFAMASASPIGVQDIEDFGVRGKVFAIKERSLLEVIQSRIAEAQKSGKIKKLNAQFKKRAIESVMEPKAVKGVAHATQSRTFYFDPTIACEKDILDHLGRIVVAKGTTANPLETLAWGVPMLFIDGSAPDQVAWAKAQGGKIVLVKGRPMDLKKDYGGWFFFDQGGALVRKFGIRFVPAKVSQEGLKLKIEEVKI